MPGEFFTLNLNRKIASRAVGWDPKSPSQAGEWGRILVWRIFGGEVEVTRTLRHGQYYDRNREGYVDVITPEEWMIEVKAASSRIGIAQVRKYTRARVEGRHRGIFAVFVQNPLSGVVGPTADDVRPMNRFGWPQGRINLQEAVDVLDSTLPLIGDPLKCRK